MFELSTLKAKALEAVMEHISSNTPRHNILDVNIDIEESWILVLKGSINFGEDEFLNLQIWEVCITEAFFQFPDFTATLDARYVSEIEKYVTE